MLDSTALVSEAIVVFSHVMTCQSAGKTTFANVILRLFDFDGGELLINDVDIRRYHPSALHARSTALFQSFAKFTNATLRENTAFGEIASLDANDSVEQALELAGAAPLVCAMPQGIDTTLEYSAFDALQPHSTSTSHGNKDCRSGRRALSGGEVSCQLTQYDHNSSEFAVAARCHCTSPHAGTRL